MTAIDISPDRPAAPDVTGPRRYPSRLAANLFLVAGIVLLIVNSRWETNTLARYLLGIVVEVALALLALLFMRLERLPIRETGRFRWPELRTALLALATVPGLWAMGVGLNLISALLFGYTTPVPPSQFPSNALEALALALTTMVAAPICEEIMFRGYVQRAYERAGIWTGIVIGGLIFALYHLRFQGVFALIPVALGLGFVVWRTGSLVPAMLMHALYNTIATVILITTSFLPAQITGVLAATIACLNLLAAPLSLIALWVLYKQTQPVEGVRPPPPARAWVRWAWILPALALIGVYGYFAVSEVLWQRFPERVLDAAFELEPPPAWDEATTWTYAVQNRLGRDLGSATCSRTPREALYVIECEADYEGFDIADELPPGFDEQLEDFDWSELPFDIPGFRSAFRADPQSWTLSAAWSQPDLDVTALELSVDSTDQASIALDYPVGDSGNALGVQRPNTAPETLPVDGDTVVMTHEWAWRYGALPFDLPYGGDVTVVDVDLEGGAAVHPGFLEVEGGEPAWTPAGTYVAWRVSVTWQDAEGVEQVVTAWYDAEAPYTLVRYDDGIVSYLLESVETQP